MESTTQLLTEAGNDRGLVQLGPEEQKALKGLLLEITLDVFRFCEEKGLSCMLGGGSALGAARHRGFIPWDDDMDLIMPRKDYDRFAQLFEQQNGDKYELLIPDGKHHSYTLFMKVARKGTILENVHTEGLPYRSGVTVDIFPIENVPEIGFKRVIKGKTAELYKNAVVSAFYFQTRNQKVKELFSGTKKTKLLYSARMVLGAMMSFLPYEKWYQSYNAFVQCAEGSGESTIPTGRNHYFGEIHPNSVYYPPVDCSFEGVTLKVPADNDRYLTKLYGNYMQLPPENKRERHYYTEVKLQ